MSAALLSVVCAAVAGLLVGGGRGAASARLRRVAGRTDPGDGHSDGGRPRALAPGRAAGLPRSVLRAALAAAVVLAVTGRPAAAVVLVVLAALLGAPGRRSALGRDEVERRLAHDVPRAADLLATCLDAGASPATALAEVCTVLGDPLAGRLRPVLAAVRLGAGLDEVAGLDDVAGLDGVAGPRLDPVARLVAVLARSALTGAPAAEALRDLAADERDRARWQALERARRAGVQAVGPLAACFLPAFVLVGVLPLVVGVGRLVLDGWVG